MAAQSPDQANYRAPEIDKSEEYYCDDADFVLHSAPYNYTSDGRPKVVEFRVHRAKLAKSSVFADLLEVGTATEPTDQLPKVTLSEDDQVITILLRFLYGDISGFPEQFVDLVGHVPKELYEACFKYDLPMAQLAVELMIRYDMQKWTTKSLIGCYRIAKRNSRKDFLEACEKALVQYDITVWNTQALAELLPDEWIKLVTAREKHLKAEHRSSATRGELPIRPAKRARGCIGG